MMYRSILTLVFILLSCRLFGQDKNISGGNVFEGEPYLIINPSNPQHMIVAWIGFVPGKPSGIKTKVTFNAGKTWSNAVVLPHAATTFKSADPSLAFDNTGNLYACYIDYRQNPDSGGVYIVKSVNGGLAWGSMSKVIDLHADGAKEPLDRPWLSFNQTNNHCYVTTKPPSWVALPNRPYFSASLNAGTSWKPWRYLDSAGYLVGNAIAQPMAAITTAIDGTVHCMYPSWVVSQNPLPGFVHARSTNSGSSFVYHGAVFSTSGKNDSLAKLGSRLVADPANAAHLVFLFPFDKYGDLDVWMIETNNKGDTWTAPVRINDDAQNNGKLQDLIWADFDTDGDLVVAWRDRRNAAGTGYETASDIWGAVRWKDSAAFSHNFVISDSLVPYNALYLSQSGNDFMGVDMVNDTLSAVWGDVRTGQLNIWFSRKDLRSGHNAGVQQIIREAVPTVQVYPNPGNGQWYFKGDEVTDLTVYDISGKKILQKSLDASNQVVDIRSYPAGVYMLYLVTANGAVSVKVTKE